MIQKFEEGRDSDGGKKAKADSSEEAGGQSRKKKNEYEGADARKRNAGKPLDDGEPSGEVIRWYRVRKTWADSKSQKGAYKILDNAKQCADQNPGYKVFDADGKVVYEPKAAEPECRFLLESVCRIST